MSGNSDNNHSNHNFTPSGIRVPIVVFGALSVGIALTGTSAVAADNTFKTTGSLPGAVSAEAPKLTRRPDGSVVPTTALTQALPGQPTQQAAKQDSNSWRVIVNEDGTLSVVSADEVPDNATEVTCSPDGICTPVTEAKDTTASEDTMAAPTEAPTEAMDPEGTTTVSNEADSMDEDNGRYSS